MKTSGSSAPAGASDALRDSSAAHGFLAPGLGCGQQLIPRRQLDPRALLVRTPFPLLRVDRAPALYGDEVRLALGEQRLDVVGIRIRRRRQPIGREVLGEASHCLVGVALVRAEDSR